MPSKPKPVRALLAKADRLARQGQLAPARQAYREVLTRFPANQNARKALKALDQPTANAHHVTPEVVQTVMALVRAADFANAAKMATALLQLEPDHFALLEIAALCHRRLGAPQQAIPLYERALQQQDSAAIWAEMGGALMECGQLQSAAAALEQATTRSASQARYWVALSRCQVQLGRPAQAKLSIDHALANAPQDPDALAQKGHVLLLLGHPEAARDALHHSLAADPKGSIALCNLAALERAMGNRTKARDHYADAVALAPQAPELHRNLSMVHDYTPDDPHIATMQKLLANTNGDDARSQLHFALWGAFDQLGACDAAFEHLSQGNQLRRKFLNYDPARNTALLPWLRSITVPDMPEPDHTGLRPIFVTGLPRSGTTLTETLLADHSSAAPAGELPVINQHIAPLLHRLNAEHRKTVSAEEAAVIAEALRRDLAQYAGGASVVIDKMPLNFRYLGLIHAILPEARFIHLTRDPMANGWSLYRHCFGTLGNGFCYDMQDIAHYMALERAHVAALAPVLQGRLLQVSYETMVQDPDATVAQMLDHAGLPRQESAQATGRPILTASAEQVRGPIRRDTNAGWERYRSALAPLAAALALKGLEVCPLVPSQTEKPHI